MSSQKDKHLTQFDLPPLRGQKRDSGDLESESLPRFPESLQIERAVGRLTKVNKPTPSQESTRKIPKGQKDLVLPSIVDTEKRSPGSSVIRKESPWGGYKKVYHDELIGPAAVVIDRKHPSRIYVIRKYNCKDKDAILRAHRAVHENVVFVQEYFEYRESIFVLHEHLPLCLDSLVACPAYPNEIQLASIIGQILNGLSYLEANDLCLEPLSCSDILLSMSGEVKIGKLEYVYPTYPNWVRRHVRSLGTITMKLMEGDNNEDGVIGIKNLTRWPSNSNAVNFVSTTTSAFSLDELRKHAFVSMRRWDKGELVWLVLYALKTSWNSCNLCG